MDMVYQPDLCDYTIYHEAFPDIHGFYIAETAGTSARGYRETTVQVDRATRQSKRPVTGSISETEKETPVSSPLPSSAFSVKDAAVPDVWGSTQAISSGFSCHYWMQMP